MAGDQTENDVVTAVVAKKNSSLCIVAFANGEFIELHTDLIVRFKITKNSTLNPNNKLEIIKEQRLFDVKQAALHFVSYKARTEKQVRVKLNTKGYSPEEQSFAIKFLYEFKYLDDKKFAIDYLKSYLKKKPVAPTVLFFELMKNGVEKNLAKSIIDEYYPEDNNYLFALAAAEKKLRTMKTKPPDKQRRSLFSFLKGRGFSWDIIKKISDNLLIDSNNDQPGMDDY